MLRIPAAFFFLFLLVNESVAIEASILTCSPGDDLYSVFGHSAIRIRDEEKNIDLVYNYGTFNFNTDGFYVKFARGKLDYMISREPFHIFQYEYLVENRWVKEQKLLIPEANALKLWMLLEENLKPENRYYKYDFFFDNCATRIWDMVNLACDNQLVMSPVESLGTFRETVESYLLYMPWSKIGIAMALGAPYDRKMKPGEQAFLPDYLMAQFAGATLNGQPICAEPEELLNREDHPKRASMLPVLISMALLFWFGWLFYRHREQSLIRIGKVLAGATSIVGVVLILLWFATDHLATVRNPDLLWCFPFSLFFRGKNKGRKAMSWLAFVGTLTAFIFYFFIAASLTTKLFFIPLIASLLIYRWSVLRSLSR
jgi:hypothetical protein